MVAEGWRGMGARVRPADGAGAATDAQEGAALLRNWSRHHCRFALVRVRARVSACVRACVARGCSCTGRLEEKFSFSLHDAGVAHGSCMPASPIFLMIVPRVAIPSVNFFSHKYNHAGTYSRTTFSTSFPC